MMNVQLTKRQRKIVKKIAKLQLESLYSILKGTCDEDLTMFCIERDIPQNALKELTQRNIDTFEALIKYPSMFMNLPEHHMVAFKQLLLTQIPQSEARREIWGKILINEYYPINPN